MNTRLTIDLGDPLLIRLLRLEAAQKGRTLREIVTEAIQAHLYEKKENRALMKLAEEAFDEWDNPKDAQYDRL